MKHFVTASRRRAMRFVCLFKGHDLGPSTFGFCQGKLKLMACKRCGMRAWRKA